MTTPPPVQPLPFRLLLDEAISISRRYFMRLYPSVAIPLAVVGGLATAAQAYFMSMLPTETQPNPDLAHFFGGMGVFFLAMLVFFLIYMLGYGALLAGAIDAAAGRAVSMSRAWGLMLRPRVLGTNLLGGLAVVAGLMCCMLPGLYLGLLFAFVLPVMVEEGVYGTAAMTRSTELARYNPQRSLDSDPRVKVFLVVFVGTLLGYGLSMIVQLPLIVAQQYLMIRDVAGGEKADPGRVMALMMWFQVPSQVIGMLVNTAVNLYVCFGLALLFFDVKGRKEGLDLEAAIARLAAAPEEPA